MGRQIQIVATHRDCWSLIDFIGETSPVRVFRSFAEKETELWFRSHELPEQEFAIYYIWPTRFPWKPKWSITGGPKCPPERAGKCYISNKSIGPVIELSSAIFSTGVQGRIYWARHWAADYDLKDFDRLVSRLFRHVRLIAEKSKYGSTYLWYLPEAWSRKADFERAEQGAAANP